MRRLGPLYGGAVALVSSTPWRWPDAVTSESRSSLWVVLIGLPIGFVAWLAGGALAWPLVLATLLLSAVASAMVHIPAGIGVLEAVFVAVLGGLAPEPQLLAALLAYRAVYYLFPLLLALAFYAAFEARRGKSLHAPGKSAG